MLPNPMEDIARRLVNYEKRLSHLERLEGGGYTKGARVYNNANINIANAAWQALTFNSERYDTDGIHSIVANTSRLTCQTAGKYLVFATMAFAQNATGFRQTDFYLNGAIEIALEHRNPRATVPNSYHTISTVYDLEKDDYVEIRVYQNSGGAINILSAGNRTPEFGMQRIG